MQNMMLKHNMGKVKKCRSFKICLKLNDCEFKTSRYSYKATYMNSMVTANQKPIVGIQKPKRKKLQKSRNQKGKEQKEQLQKQLEIK